MGFKEVFTSIDLNRWEIVETRSGVVAIDDGALRILDGRGTTTTVFRLIEGLSDYPLDIWFTFKGQGTADGFTCMFYKNDDYGTQGRTIGFSRIENEVGYCIEFDNFRNHPGSGYGMEGTDPVGSHIALMKGNYTNHLAYANYDWDDGEWHTCRITVYPEGGQDRVKVYIDDIEILSWAGTIDRTYDRFGFTAATGIYNMYVYIGEVRVGEWQPGFFAKVDGEWKQATPYVKVDGSWRPVEAGWVKDNGVWKKLMG